MRPDLSGSTVTGLDPAAKRFLDMIGAANAPDLAQVSPAQMRDFAA
jgi:hypothetical protein